MDRGQDVRGIHTRDYGDMPDMARHTKLYDIFQMKKRWASYLYLSTALAFAAFRTMSRYSLGVSIGIWQIFSIYEMPFIMQTAMTVMIFIGHVFLFVILLEASYHIEERRSIRFFINITTLTIVGIGDPKHYDARKSYQFAFIAGVISIVYLGFLSLAAMLYYYENEFHLLILLPIFGLIIQALGFKFLTDIEYLFKSQQDPIEPL